MDNNIVDIAKVSIIVDEFEKNDLSKAIDFTGSKSDDFVLSDGTVCTYHFHYGCTVQKKQNFLKED